MRSTFQLFCGRCNQPLNHHPFLSEAWAFHFMVTKGTKDYDQYDKLCDRFPADDPDYAYFSYVTTGDYDYWTTDPVEDLDYYSRPPLTEVIPYRDFTYNPGDMFTDKNREYTEWETLYENSVQELEAWQASNWYDAESNHCTSALETNLTPEEAQLLADFIIASNDDLATERKRDESFNEPHLDNESQELLVTPRNESGHNFTSEVLIDRDFSGQTALFQQKFFNFFIGRDNHAHIGQLTLATLADGRPTFICKHFHCLDRATNEQRRFDYPADDWPNPSRRGMEKFVFGAIRHGNNHGPEWLTSREDFAYIHAQNCDVSQHEITYQWKNVKNYGRLEWRRVPIATNCNTDRPIFVVADLDPKDVHACYDVILTHRKVCTDLNCRCDHYESLLWNEVYGGILIS